MLSVSIAGGRHALHAGGRGAWPALAWRMTQARTLLLLLVRVDLGCLARASAVHRGRGAFRWRAPSSGQLGSAVLAAVLLAPSLVRLIPMKSHVAPRVNGFPCRSRGTAHLGPPDVCLPSLREFRITLSLLSRGTRAARFLQGKLLKSDVTCSRIF